MHLLKNSIQVEILAIDANDPDGQVMYFKRTTTTYNTINIYGDKKITKILVTFKKEPASGIYYISFITEVLRQKLIGI